MIFLDGFTYVHKYLLHILLKLKICSWYVNFAKHVSFQGKKHVLLQKRVFLISKLIYCVSSSSKKRVLLQNA